MYTLKLEEDAPPIALPTASGGAWKLSEQRGKMVILYFARGEYCPTTRAELANWNSYARLFPKMNCQVAFLVNGGAKEHARYVEEEKFQLPILIDEDGAVGEAYGVYGVNSRETKRDDYRNYQAPSVYLINADGTIGCFWLAGGPRCLPSPEGLLGILAYCESNDWKY